jgi:hypothetical protein
MAYWLEAPITLGIGSAGAAWYLNTQCQFHKNGPPQDRYCNQRLCGNHVKSLVRLSFCHAKGLCGREMMIAAQAEQSFVAQWKPRRPKTGARAPHVGKRSGRRGYRDELRCARSAAHCTTNPPRHPAMRSTSSPRLPRTKPTEGMNHAWPASWPALYRRSCSTHCA